MSTAVFPFTVHQPYAEPPPSHRTTVYEGEGGKKFKLARWPAEGLFRVALATLWFAPSRNSIATFRAFWDARRGSYDTFLYKPVLEEFKTVTDEAIGTGDASEDTFALASKYIDASSLTVELDGTPQASGWSLSGNNTAPVVVFTSPPGGGVAVTASYERYVPCWFDQDELPLEIRSLAATDANSVLRIQSITWSQDRPGSHLV